MISIALSKSLPSARYCFKVSRFDSEMKRVLMSLLQILKANFLNKQGLEVTGLAPALIEASINMIIMVLLLS